VVLPVQVWAVSSAGFDAWLGIISSSLAQSDQDQDSPEMGDLKICHLGARWDARGYEDAQALSGCSRVCTRHGCLLVVGAVATGSSGVEVLIPETGRPGRDWIAAVDGAGG
jgi:hypothetical protein